MSRRGGAERNSIWSFWRRGENDLESLKDELECLLKIMEETHGLGEADRKFLERRWCDQTVFMKNRVILNRRCFYLLRWLAVLGAVTIPALVSLTVGGFAAAGVRWATFALSLVVAVATAWEALFRYGRRWRLYRRSLDILRAEGWSFATRLGSYKGKSGKEAFEAFASAVERTLREYSEGYIHDVILEPDTRVEGSPITPPEPATTIEQRPSH